MKATSSTTMLMNTMKTAIYACTISYYVYTESCTIKSMIMRLIIHCEIYLSYDGQVWLQAVCLASFSL